MRLSFSADALEPLPDTFDLGERDSAVTGELAIEVVDSSTGRAHRVKADAIASLDSSIDDVIYVGSFGPVRTDAAKC